MKLTDRALYSAASPTQLIHVVVTGDTSQNPAGSSYKIPLQYIVDLVPPSTATTSDSYWTSGTTGPFSIRANNNSGLDATAPYAVAEGSGTKAQGSATHAEGSGTTAQGLASHAEGLFSVVTSGSFAAHAEGSGTTASGLYSHAEGQGTTASNQASHAEGRTTTAIGLYSHAEGFDSVSIGNGSHAEGKSTIAQGANSHSEGDNSTAIGIGSHAEGVNTTASSNATHAEGSGTTAIGIGSHAEGVNTTASSNASHSEGSGTTAVGSFSHTEGVNTTAFGQASHAEGSGTTATGIASHAGGYNSTAIGEFSFVHGSGSTATANHAVVLGPNLQGLTASTVYTPALNIKTLMSDTVKVLGVDGVGTVGESFVGDTLTLFSSIGNGLNSACCTFPINSGNTYIVSQGTIVKDFAFSYYNGVETIFSASPQTLTLSFGTYNNSTGLVSITKPGYYLANAALDLKPFGTSINTGTYNNWLTGSTEVGEFSIGFVDNTTTNEFTKTQTVVLSGITKGIAINASLIFYVKTTQNLRLGVINKTNRHYDNSENTTGPDVCRFSVTRLK